MRVLIIKTSSLGDVIHTFPALTDASRAIPGIQFDWVVEESFAEIPAWHPNVQRVIPVAWRRWRKSLTSAQTRAELRECFKQLQLNSYDYIIDAQGLVKSALLGLMAKGVRCGYDGSSAREPLASLFYQRKFPAEKIKNTHAITRIRRLVSDVLGYPLPLSTPEYGLDRQAFSANVVEKKYVMFLHGTTWATKHWPEEYWRKLAVLVTQQGIEVKLPWGNLVEYERAQRIAEEVNGVSVLPQLKLKELAGVIAGAKAIVAVDTGLGHLAAALNVPTVSLYGPTDPALTGALGESQVHLSVTYACSPCLSSKCFYRDELPINPPCFSTLFPERVWEALMKML